MSQQKRSSIRSLLLILLLVIGPVQAQTLFACEMMEEVILDTCCCDDHPDLADVSIAKSDPCCEKRVELSVDHASDQTTPITKPVEVRSDVDPPAMLIATQLNPPNQRADRAVFPSSANAAPENGSRTYLVTQRLRI